MSKKTLLNINILCAEAKKFAAAESNHDEKKLYGATDGKAIGTYLEHKFISYLLGKYEFLKGNSANGIDIPSINVDIKVTSIQKPQSSTPFKFPEQKIYGLGHHLIIFTYEKRDDRKLETARLNIRDTIFIDKECTADFQMTKGICEILDRNGNEDDITAFLFERNLLVDDIKAEELAKQIMINRPKQGYLTISNAYQWRLSFNRAITEAGNITGIQRIR